MVHGLTGSTAATLFSGAAGLLAFALPFRRLRLALDRVQDRERALAEAIVADGPARGPQLADLSVDMVIDAFPDPVLIVENGRVAAANAAALDLLGAHIRGADARIAIRHPAVTEHLFGPDKATESMRMELVGIGAPDRSWELGIEPLSPSVHMVLLTDKSARQQAERMRVDFVANASHELRTPLAGILGYIETLKDEEAGGDPAVRDRFLTIIDREARRMQRLVEDLLSLSRIEADKFRQPEQIVDLSDLVEETVLLLRRNGDGRAVDIVADLDLSVPPVRGDAAQLGQLAHNLLTNALKYGRPGTPVTVSVRHAESGGVTLLVTDQGDGIAPEHLPRLTERFYRVDSSRSKAIGGTGLGLAIVKHIVERHRGRLHIDSSVGQGTQVSVLLPRA